MTIKEMADLLQVSKPTISRAIKELNISPQKVGNKFVLTYEEAKTITKYIFPADDAIVANFSDFSTKMEQSQQNETKIDKSQQGQGKTATNQNKSPQIETQLLQMLEKQIEEKDSLIRSQQEQIDLLIKSNTALIAKVTMLEDKQQEPREMIVNTEESKEPSAETPIKKHWWDRFFKG